MATVLNTLYNVTGNNYLHASYNNVQNFAEGATVANGYAISAPTQALRTGYIAFPTDSSNAFKGLNNLQIDMQKLANTISFNYVFNMSNMFNNCRNITGHPMSGPYTTDMSNAFRNCTNLTGDYYSSVTNILDPQNRELWISPSVTNISYAFYNCVNMNFNEVGMFSRIGWGNITDMSYAFYNCNIPKGLMLSSILQVRTAPGANVVGAFMNCHPIDKITFNEKESITSLAYTFANSTLTAILAPWANLTNMSRTYFSCTNLIGSPLCGDNVTDFSFTYQNCYNLTGSPVCGSKVTNMASTYYFCRNLTGSPVCGTNVTNMYYAYGGCQNLTGSPVCGPKVTNMYSTYYSCNKLTGSPVCGANVTDMSYAYYNCQNLTSSPVCGSKVTNMSGTYSNCINLTGSVNIGSNVTNIAEAYRNCYKLTGSPIATPHIVSSTPTMPVSMYATYYNCQNLTGAPAIPLSTAPLVSTYVELASAYFNCFRLTGSLPSSSDTRWTVFTSIENAFYNCTNLTGSPLSSPSCEGRNSTYFNCSKLTGKPSDIVISTWPTSPFIGIPGGIWFVATYYNCKNLSGRVNFYMPCPVSWQWRNIRGYTTSYGREIFAGCFYGCKNLDIYVNNQVLFNYIYNTTNLVSIMGAAITWTNIDSTNFRNTANNINVYYIPSAS